MEYDKIKQLMDDMGNSKLTSIEIDFPDGMKISMKKEEKQIVIVASIDNNNEVINREKCIINENLKDTNNSENDNVSNEEENCNIVKSPMVGTFYLKPSPDSEPYVQIGKKVKKGDVLCIIEAMKLMNEIESEFDGEILEILVKDGEPVEYGKSLFKIK